MREKVPDGVRALTPLQILSVHSEYRESLGLPMLGARFPYWLVLCAHITSGYAGPCPSAWGLVLPSSLAL